MTDSPSGPQRFGRTGTASLEGDTAARTAIRENCPTRESSAHPVAIRLQHPPAEKASTSLGAALILMLMNVREA